MNRIDRLTAMILMLQSQRVVTAEQMAERFEISVRTVYRDIAALGEAGVPIVAEAGVGYGLMRGYHLPPVMFTEQEAAALFMGGELTEQFGDESLKQSSREALLKVRAALPEDRKDYLVRLGKAVQIRGRARGLPEARCLMPMQEAVVRRRCVFLRYDAGGLGGITERVVEPLGVVYYGRHWHLIGWCRLRKEFRDFRLDRMRRWDVLPETFAGHENFSVVDFLENGAAKCEFVPVALTCERWALEKILAEMPARLVERTELPDKRFRIRALAYSLDWLAGWLLGLGAAAEADAPQTLREKVAEAARAVAARYEARKARRTRAPSAPAQTLLT